jgi:hypothetical protein
VSRPLPRFSDLQTCKRSDAPTFIDLSPLLATHPKKRPLSPMLATLPKTPSRNSFVCHTCKTPSPGGWSAFVQPRSFPHSPLATHQSPLATRFFLQPLSFHILAHSFALMQKATLLFSSNSALFAENTRGGGTRDVFRAKLPWCPASPDRVGACGDSSPFHGSQAREERWKV